MSHETFSEPCRMQMGSDAFLSNGHRLRPRWYEPVCGRENYFVLRKAHEENPMKNTLDNFDIFLCV